MSASQVSWSRTVFLTCWSTTQLRNQEKEFYDDWCSPMMKILASLVARIDMHDTCSCHWILKNPLKTNLHAMYFMFRYSESSNFVSMMAHKYLDSGLESIYLEQGASHERWCSPSILVNFCKMYGQYGNLAGIQLALLSWYLFPSGHVFGGGCAFAFVFDYRIMNLDHGWFCVNEVHIGFPLQPLSCKLMKWVEYNALSPVFRIHSVYYLISSRVKLVPWTFHEAGVFGRRYNGVEACEAGIVQMSASSKSLLQTALQKAKEMPQYKYTLHDMKCQLYEEVLSSPLLPALNKGAFESKIWKNPWCLLDLSVEVATLMWQACLVSQKWLYLLRGHSLLSLSSLCLLLFVCLLFFFKPQSYHSPLLYTRYKNDLCFLDQLWFSEPNAPIISTWPFSHLTKTAFHFSYGWSIPSVPTFLPSLGLCPSNPGHIFQHWTNL